MANQARIPHIMMPPTWIHPKEKQTLHATDNGWMIIQPNGHVENIVYYRGLKTKLIELGLPWDFRPDAKRKAIIEKLMNNQFSVIDRHSVKIPCPLNHFTEDNIGKVTSVKVHSSPLDKIEYSLETQEIIGHFDIRGGEKREVKIHVVDDKNDEFTLKFNASVTPNLTPRVVNDFPPIITCRGAIYNQVIPDNIFCDPEDTLTYTLEPIPGYELPEFFQIQNNKAITGMADRAGEWTANLVATDSVGNRAEVQVVLIAKKPLPLDCKKKIQNYSLKTAEKFEIPLRDCFTATNPNVTYNVSLEAVDSITASMIKKYGAWISLDSTGLNISGTAPDEGLWTVRLVCTDSLGQRCESNIFTIHCEPRTHMTEKKKKEEKIARTNKRRLKNLEKEIGKITITSEIHSPDQVDVKHTYNEGESINVTTNENAKTSS